MKFLALAKKFTSGFKEGWNECQSDGNVEWQEGESISPREESVQNYSLISEDVSPNDTSHPYHDYYYGNK